MTSPNHVHMHLNDPSPRERELSGQPQRTLAVSVAATFLVLVAYTAPLSTMGRTIAELHTTPSGQAWILSAMSVGLAAALLVSGAIADAHGRRRVFVGGALVVALGSLLAAGSPDTLTLIVARVVQGVGGAALTSCSLGLLGHSFPEPAARARATGLWGASVGAGISAGPLVAAGLDVVGGWRASHVLLTALALLLALAASRWLVESRAEQARRVDYVGATLLALGLASALGGLVEGRSGWLAPATLVLLGAGALLLVAFVVSLARRSDPLLSLALLRRPDFAGATAGALATGLGVIALMSFVPSLVTRGLGRSALAASVTVLAWSGVSVVSALAARRLPATIPARWQMIGGLLGVAAGQATLAGLHTDSTIARLVPGLLIAGVASGFLNASLARQAVASVPAGSAAMGSGANNTARYVGAALGLTAVVMLAGRSDPAALIAGWNHAVLLTTSLSVLGALVVLALR